MSFLPLAARLALAAPFALQGLDAVIAPEDHRERAANLAPLTEPVLGALGLKLTDATMDMAARGLGAAYLAGTAGLATGIAPRLASAGLALAHVPVTLANYPFWKHETSQRRDDAIGLAQGVAMIGGALLAGGLVQGRA